MVWLPDGEKTEDTFIRFDRIHERDRHPDRQTDRQTPHAWFYADVVYPSKTVTHPGTNRA